MNRHMVPATSFYFRTTPSSIFSTAHDYCHAEIRFPRAPVLEAHIGIYVSGKSRVNHECDVAVIYHDEATTCRTHNVHPRSSKVLMSVECKYYLSSTLGIDLGRSFLGLIDDIYTDGRFFVSTQNTGSVTSSFPATARNMRLGCRRSRRIGRYVSADRLRRYFETSARDEHVRPDEPLLGQISVRPAQPRTATAGFKASL